MRATAGTSALSSSHATLVITNLFYLALRNSGFGVIIATVYVSVLVFGAGFLGLLGLRETYHRGMNFVEDNAPKTITNS